MNFIPQVIGVILRTSKTTFHYIGIVLFLYGIYSIFKNLKYSSWYKGQGMTGKVYQCRGNKILSIFLDTYIVVYRHNTKNGGVITENERIYVLKGMIPRTKEGDIAKVRYDRKNIKLRRFDKLVLFPTLMIFIGLIFI